MNHPLVARIAAIAGHALAAGDSFADVRRSLTTVVSGARPIALSSTELLAGLQSLDERVRQHIDPLFAGELVLWWEAWIAQSGLVP